MAQPRKPAKTAPLIRSSVALRGIATALTLSSFGGVTAFAATHVQNPTAPLQPTAPATIAASPTATPAATSRTTARRSTTVAPGVATATTTARTRTRSS
jgi:hypothetical protein